jgi:hypothetical protein
MDLFVAPNAVESSRRFVGCARVRCGAGVVCRGGVCRLQTVVDLGLGSK